MSDTITTIGQSMIQHGPYNDRIYLMKLSEADFPEIIPELDRLAVAAGYSKVFAKIPAYARTAFFDAGFNEEAFIPKFYNGARTAYFMGKYYAEERKVIKNGDVVANVLEVSRIKPSSAEVRLPLHLAVRRCDVHDIPAMSELYDTVFATYPFPIQDPDYILHTMHNDVAYFGVWDHSTLVALASAEMDLQAQNVEMTDFATLPEYRGQSLATYLLSTMQRYVQDKGLKTAYTIARAVSYGMNATFAKMNYIHSGTLINNTNISGNMECMNIWYKHL